MWKRCSTPHGTARFPVIRLPPKPAVSNIQLTPAGRPFEWAALSAFFPWGLNNMRRILTLVLLAVVAMSVAGCHHAFGMMMGKMLAHGYYDDWAPYGEFDDDCSYYELEDDFWEEADEEIAGHMIASAKLTAHFVAAAIAAGMTTEEINAVLEEVADESAIAEFWVTDEDGNVVYTNNPDVEFKFPTDPDGDTQAAPFAALLNGDETVVVQDMQPREADGRLFQYVGVAGVDQTRIVQVGVDGEEHWLE